jgi:hypothetical protein
MAIPVKVDMNRPATHLSPLPRVDICWTQQELVSLAKLLSRRPRPPTVLLVRAMKEAA